MFAVACLGEDGSTPRSIPTMSGIIVPILPYTEYNYNWAVGVTEELIIADNIPVAPFTKIGLSVRVHRRTIATGGSFQFVVRGINPSSRDGQDFVFATDLGSTPTITTATATPGLLQLSSLIVDPQHPMIRVVLRIVGPTAAGACFAVLSADLTMKTG
jgi:hypothetical protein